MSKVLKPLGTLQVTAAGPNEERRARFHYNAKTPDDPWHITVDFGNRNTWDNGNGFFRRGYHIYAKNNDLSQGYAGYNSPIHKTSLGRVDQVTHKGNLPLSGRNDAEPITVTSLDNTEATTLLPCGAREYYRHPKYREYLHRTTYRSLKPPTTMSESQARRTPWKYRLNPTTGTREKASRPKLQDELNDMIRRIRHGTSKPAIPSKEGFMIRDSSGDWVHIRQAVLDARKAGKEVPFAWKVVLKNFHAHDSRCRMKETARSLGETPARFAFGTTRRTTRPTTRSQGGAWRSDGLRSTQKGHRPVSKMRGPFKEALGVRQDRRGTERPQSNGSSTDKDDGKARLEIGARVSARTPKPRKSKSRPELMICDLSDLDAVNRQSVSMSAELDPKTSREERTGTSPEDGKPERRDRSRRTMRRPRATTKGLDLGQALLNAEPQPEPEAPVYQKEGPKIRKIASGDVSARPRAERSQKSSTRQLLLNPGSPLSGGSGRSPQAPTSRSRRSGASGAQKSGSDTTKAGKRTRSPLPPADVLEQGKRMKGSYKEKRPKQARVSKATPAWVEPRIVKGATTAEIHT